MDATNSDLEGFPPWCDDGNRETILPLKVRLRGKKIKDKDGLLPSSEYM